MLTGKPVKRHVPCKAGLRTFLALLKHNSSYAWDSSRFLLLERKKNQLDGRMVEEEWAGIKLQCTDLKPDLGPTVLRRTFTGSRLFPLVFQPQQHAMPSGGVEPVWTTLWKRFRIRIMVGVGNSDCMNKM